MQVGVNPRPVGIIDILRHLMGGVPVTPSIVPECPQWSGQSGWRLGLLRALSEFLERHGVILQASDLLRAVLSRSSLRRLAKSLEIEVVESTTYAKRECLYLEVQGA